MSTSSGKSHDFTAIALRAVEEAIGERLDGSLEDAPTKNLIYAAAGRLGGAKGGFARAAKLTPEQRADIARTAAAVRWRKNS